MKKIFYICAMLLVMFGMDSIKAAHSVTTMDDYGIYCNYKNPSGEEYYFKYFSFNSETLFEIETNFDKLNILIEGDRPGKLITNNEEMNWLKSKGLVNSDSNFTCPEVNPFGAPNLTLDLLACHEDGCQTGVVPNSYEEYTCSYQSQTTGETLEISYISNEEYPSGRWRILYPDGMSQVLEGAQANGNMLPSRNCPDIFYINSTKTIQLVGISNTSLTQLCRNYSIDQIEHFCASGYSCSEIEMVCPAKTTTTLKGCTITDIPEQLPKYISNIINLIKILVPIILVIMGMIDFARAVVSSDEKQMKESQSRFIKRAFAAVIIFFVIVIVQFVFRAIGTDDNILGCIDCFVNGDCNKQGNNVSNACYQCNANPDVYKWSTNGGADVSCASGYHIRTDVKNEQSCHN